MTKFFLYDGDCSFCSRLALRLQSLVLNSEIQFHSFRNLSKRDLENIHPNLNSDVCVGNVQYIYGSQRYPGFFAVRKLSHSLKIYRYFSILLYLPFIPIFGMIAMNLLKKYKTNL
ncbi:MAG: DUF393 domain-containing protein [Leptospira sp.]|nr:DUF393 domain-containing protein [Leptospira sp.]NCS93960.1 DUF393 domain-containing protein [Leptospira sp.]